MTDNHPAKIAKYLLKGWCLLNEYCPHGHNIPLVRSKEGETLCVGCVENLPVEGAAPSSAGTAPAPAAETVVSAASEPMKVTASHSSVVTPSLSSLSTTPLRMGGTAASAGLAEVTVQGPEHRFSCVRLDYRSKGVPRLLGESYVARVRASLAAPGSSPDVAAQLQEGVSTALEQLSDRILVPPSCAGAVINKEGGQVKISRTGDGHEFVLPQCDCVFVQGGPEFIAKWLLDALVARADIATMLQSASVQWLEVCLSFPGGEVTYKSALRSSDFGSAGYAAASGTRTVT